MHPAPSWTGTEGIGLVKAPNGAPILLLGFPDLAPSPASGGLSIFHLRQCSRFPQTQDAPLGSCRLSFPDPVPMSVSRFTLWFQSSPTVKDHKDRGQHHPGPRGHLSFLVHQVRGMGGSDMDSIIDHRLGGAAEKGKGDSPLQPPSASTSFPFPSFLCLPHPLLFTLPEDAGCYHGA